MQIVFCGIARQAGTSANMAAAASGFMQYLKYPVTLESGKRNFRSEENEIIFTDCGHRIYEKESIKSCSLLVLNLSIPCQGIEDIYLDHSFVHKNIIFLVGKYHQNQSGELKKLIRQYRIDPSRICTIPYNMRFQKAHCDGKVSSYIRSCQKEKKSCEDALFERNLKYTLNKIITYGKGENYYG